MGRKQGTSAKGALSSSTQASLCKYSTVVAFRFFILLHPSVFNGKRGFFQQITPFSLIDWLIIGEDYWRPFFRSWRIFLTDLIYSNLRILNWRCPLFIFISIFILTGRVLIWIWKFDIFFYSRVNGPFIFFW